jgi:benzoyl-CoA-dihydrodiol lyase
VDEIAAPANFARVVQERAAKVVAASTRPSAVKGIELRSLTRKIDDAGYHYSQVDVVFDRDARTAAITVRGPVGAQPETIDAIYAAGDSWWPLAMARELDDAILMLRTNEPELGLFLLKTAGNISAILKMDLFLDKFKEDWLVRETVGLLRRTLARLDVSSRSMFAIIDPGSCFAGTLLELALAADRSYMLADAEDAKTGDSPSVTPKIALSAMNFGIFPMINGRGRLETRFRGELQKLAKLRAKTGISFSAADAMELGLVTLAPDDLDWEDELRMAIEERASLSPDALTGMEANLRFPGPETTDTKIFGRLSAWQNWVFIRPSATGENGALRLFGKGSKPKFDWERV